MPSSSSYPQANCRISGGLLKESDLDKKPFSTFRSHNFVDKLDLLLPKKLYSSISSSQLFDDYKCYTIKSGFNEILNEKLLSLIRADGIFVKLMTKTKNDSDPVVCSIINNQLCITLDRMNSLKTGISMKKSQFKGVERFNVVIDLTLPKLGTDPTFLKILKFFQSLEGDTNEFVLAIYDKSYTPTPLDQGMLTEFKGSYKEVTEITISPVVSEMPQVSIVDLEIKENDLDWALQVLEYMSYLSIEGQQLTHTVDPYLSQYSESLNFVGKEDVVKMSFHSLLIPSASILESFIKNKGDQSSWFAVLSHGVPNSNYSFGLSEHLIHEGGENDLCYLQNNENYVLWEIIGGRDSY